MFESLGYTFKDTSLLETALTHTSFSYEHKEDNIQNNERLEFLGDAVLELVISTYIFKNFRELSEGELTKLRASIVCESSLAKKARELKIGENLRLGKGEEQTGGRNRDSLLADAFEAILGSIYMDADFNVVEQFILKKMNQTILDKRVSFKTNDSKTYLQEMIQKYSQEPIEYRVISEEGPAHEKIFTVEVLHQEEVLAQGNGKSKKDAEQEAAANAIKKLKNLIQ